MEAEQTHLIKTMWKQNMLFAQFYKSDDKIVCWQTLRVSLITKINGWLCVSQRKAMHGDIDVMDCEDGYDQ